MVKLRWLQVNKFRSVKPGTRLTFNPGYNVLLGQNGTGKTTLLNLVAAAIKSDFAEFKDEEFDLSYELASDEATATISVRNEIREFPVPSILPLEAAIPLSADVLRSAVLSIAASLSSKLTCLQVKLDIEGLRGSAQRTDGKTPDAQVEFDLSIIKDWPPSGLIGYGLTWWEKTKASIPQASSLFSDTHSLFVESRTRRFDESLEYFNNLGELKAQLTRLPDGNIGLSGDLAPAMRERLRSLARNRWGADRYMLADTELPFLKHTIQLLDFESAEAIIELKDSVKRARLDIMHLGNLRFYFSHRGGWKISEKMLSYGQKRILAFLHYLSLSESTVIADELVNGLHHRWIRACFEALGDRQVFLTSQNPLLLDYLNFQSPEDVRSTFVLCKWEKGPEQMAWENMSQEAAEDFFASYKVGFQQVGELLQSKGLW